MEIISIHKKNRGAKDLGYTWKPPAKGIVRAQVIKDGRTQHIDIKQ